MAKTKSYDGEDLPASAFLVVGDPQEPSTWHLPVKKANGSVDRRRMGAAKAALTSAGGHRGQKYAGPNKQEAIRKLKALYKKEDMIWEADVDLKHEMSELDAAAFSVGRLSTMIREAFDLRFRPGPGVYDEARGRRRPWMRDFYIGHPRLGDAVIANQEGLMYAIAMDLSGEKPTFAEEAQWRQVRPTYELVQPPEAASEITGAEADVDLGTFLESAQAIDMEEKAGAGARDPLSIRFVMIKPGFGNPKDNHYYPREVLERDAGKFVGAKMYATDHRADQRSVLTEVAVIDNISGYTDDGAPIAEATVWGPDFAEQVRNRAKVGKLHLLECSIIGRGKAKRGKVDGREAKIVQEIEEGKAVDWVSRAGAGGHALDISESNSIDDGGETVDEKEKQEQIEESADPAANVDIQESETEEVQPQENETEVTTQEAALSQDAVASLLEESGLGERAQRLLVGATYKDKSAVQSAIQEMKSLIKEATGAGKPFEQGATTQDPVEETDGEFWAGLNEQYGTSFYVEEKEQ